MTGSRAKAAAAKKPGKEEGAPKSPDSLTLVEREGKSRAEIHAEASLSPVIRNAILSKTYGDEFFGCNKDGERSDIDASVAFVTEKCAEVRAGNLDHVTDMLVAQMATLDTLFTTMCSRAGSNMGKYPEAVDRYFNWAMKAQAGCRTTAETLARIKRGGKQTVKVVHVHEGGQAVVADTVNQQTNHSGRGVDGGSGLIAVLLLHQEPLDRLRRLMGELGVLVAELDHIVPRDDGPHDRDDHVIGRLGRVPSYDLRPPILLVAIGRAVVAIDRRRPLVLERLVPTAVVFVLQERQEVGGDFDHTIPLVLYLIGFTAGRC